jgi:hypothetical protein
VDAFGREPSYEEILFGKRNGWNALEEETTSRKDKKYNHRAAVNGGVESMKNEVAGESNAGIASSSLHETISNEHVSSSGDSRDSELE